MLHKHQTEQTGCMYYAFASATDTPLTYLNIHEELFEQALKQFISLGFIPYPIFASIDNKRPISKTQFQIFLRTAFFHKFVFTIKQPASVLHHDVAVHFHTRFQVVVSDSQKQLLQFFTPEQFLNSIYAKPVQIMEYLC